MKHAVLPILLSGTALVGLTACSQPKALKDEPYEAVAYTLYPAPENAYVGDTMPFVTEEGKLELYYLYDTDHNGQGYHPIYRYVTDDFCGYEDKGMAMNFGNLSDPDPAVGTGSVMRDSNGLYHLFYTGHNDAGNNGQGKECVMHATSTDRQTWTKIPEDTFFSPDNYSKDDFRDPEVFWMEEENCYWMLMAARENSKGGVVLKYTSTDLKNWTVCEPIYAPMQQYMLECPSLLKIKDTWYLTYSWDCVTYYAVGDSPNGPFRAPADNVLDGSGFIFYAAKTKSFHDHDYLCGWLGRMGTTSDTGFYQWAGSVLNHELVQKEDGSLGVKEPSSFHDYFTKEKTFQAVKKNGTVKVKDSSVTLSAKEGSYALADMGTRPATMMLECDVTLDAGGNAGFAFGGSADDEAWTALCLDAARNQLHYEGTYLEELSIYDPVAITNFAFEPGTVHHVRLICENEIVVLYIDDTKALSSRITHSINGAHIGLFADGCSAAFTNITMHLPE